MANRYWVGGTTNWDATAGTKWSDVSGGAGGFSVPTSADDVFFDAASGSVTSTITATANCKSLTCTGFPGTLAGSSALNIAGNIIIGSGMTFTYSGLLSITATSTIVSNGKTLTCSLIISAATITTLSDAAIVTGNVTFGNSHTLNGSTLTVGGNLTSSVSLVGTATNIILNGTGTWTGTLGNSLEINTVGTITFGATCGIICNTTTFKHTAGTVVTTGSTFSAVLNGTNILTMDCAAITLFNFTQGGRVSLSNNVTISGNYILQFNVDIIGSFNLTIGGSMTITGIQPTASSATIILNGTGTWSGGGQLRTNLIINTAGTITLSGTVYFGTGTLIYTSGTVITTGSTLNCILSTTLNTNGINFENITFGGTSQTFTLLSDLTLTGLLTLNGATTTTFSGAYNVYLGNGMTINNASHTVTSNSLAKPTFIINNTLTWTHASTSQFGCNLTIDCGANTFSIGSGIGLRFGSSVSSELKYISGTINSTNKSLLLFGVVTVNTTSSVVWNSVTMTGSITITLASDLYCSGQLTHNTNAATINGTGFYIYTGGYTKSTSGNLTGIS